jgi:hypothetical protein
MANKVGRPSKLTATVKARLIDAIKRGASTEVACSAAGVGYSTVRDWIVIGEGRHATKKPTREFKEFSEDVTRAIADSEMALITKVQQGAGQDWRAAAWILERRFSDRWANTQRIEVKVREQVEEEFEQFYDALEAELEPETYEALLNAVDRIQSRGSAAQEN